MSWIANTYFRNFWKLHYNIKTEENVKIINNVLTHNFEYFSNSEDGRNYKCKKCNDIVTLRKSHLKNLHTKAKEVTYLYERPSCEEVIMEEALG